MLSANFMNKGFLLDDLSEDELKQMDENLLRARLQYGIVIRKVAREILGIPVKKKTDGLLSLPVE